MALAQRHDAVVVGLQNYRETDRIVRLLTPDRGRVDALARGARTSRRRFAGALDLGNHLVVHLKRGRGTLDFLEDADLVDARLHLRTDFDRIALATFACELCASPARADHAEPKLFGLLQTVLVVLDATEGVPAGAFRAGLCTKAATFVGLRPHLVDCRVCRTPAADPMGWQPLSGGAAHRDCDPTAPAVSLEWLEAVEAARRTPLRELVDRPLPPGPLSTLSHAVEDQVGRAFQSRILLDATAELPEPR